jgi:hypothetical protein
MPEEILEVEDGPSLPRLELRRTPSNDDIADEKGRWAPEVENSGHMLLVLLLVAVVAAEFTSDSKVGESPRPSSDSYNPKPPLLPLAAKPLLLLNE